MVNHSTILGTSSFQSVIASQGLIRPTAARWTRGLAADLLLTALIDAFSILVIFLLMNFSSTGDIIYMSKNMELPKAARGDVLDRNTVVKIDSEKIFIEDKEVAVEGLVAGLLDVRKQFQDTHPGEEFSGTLTVQADRHLRYEFLNRIVLASSQAGFSDLHFAVIMK
jgi:biopolymer transport protein ExbD